jgi:para-nitrobenzyl esterase
MFRMFMTLTVAAALGGNTVSAAFGSETTSATVESGALRGTVEQDVRIFKGVPFATAPVGELRWRAPRAPQHWAGERDATEFGASCMQPTSLPSMPPPMPPVSAERKLSEDCLFLNIWAPKSAKKLPVLISLHGGGFFLGSGAMDTYDGTSFAKQGVIAVTVNYRLGPLGFFSHPELTTEAKDEPSANFGFLDQVAALDWVKRNIAAFGGDPTNITVAGGSAGSMSVNLMMTSRLTAGLFQRAIATSGPMRLRPNPPGSPSGVEQAGLQLAQALARLMRENQDVVS